MTFCVTFPTGSDDNLTLCGSYLPAVPPTQCYPGGVRLTFHSDSDTTATGFIVEYWEEPIDNMDGEYPNPNHPSYPPAVPPTLCHPCGVRLTFHSDTPATGFIVEYWEEPIDNIDALQHKMPPLGT